MAITGQSVTTGNQEQAGKKPSGFARIKPLLSALKRPAKVCAKAAAGVLLVGAIAIGGANLGTYFDYKYNNYDYGRLRNRTTISLKGEGVADTPLVRSALEAARLKIVGHKPPEEAYLNVELSRDALGIIMNTRYVMVWSTNKGIAKRDEEEVRIGWRMREQDGKFVPLAASTRFHNKWVDMPLTYRADAPVIVIQNPAHTPGIPGTSPRYVSGEPGTVDVFTMFSAGKWAGSCLSTNLPQKFDSMNVEFRATVSQK